MLNPEKQWPPDYVPLFAWRQQQLLMMRSRPELLYGAKQFYKTRPASFIAHWCDTYDPRNAGSNLPTRMPFILFQRQIDLVRFLMDMINHEENGLIEKCRDMGATWVCCCFSIWLWLFWDGASVGWGSRKEQLVDKLGDADSIFEKMRMVVRYLPDEFLPQGFNPKDHMTYMRFINPENESTITGESGDNIGRGGRKLIYFKDESAHYEHPELIEASLTDNTYVQIDISSVNGTGTVFHRKRSAGEDWKPKKEIKKGRTHVFVMDWRDHPGKSQDWYDTRKAKAQEEGLLHLFAQEVDRDYSASVEGIIIPAVWIDSAYDAHKKLGFSDDGLWSAALDVADGGMDKNAIAARKGVVLKSAEEWGERDTGKTARRAVNCVKNYSPIKVQYDCIGVGSGIKAEINRLDKDEKILPKGIQFIPWDAGSAVQKPDDNVIKGDKKTPLNKDFYANLKAQGWWNLRMRFEKTHRAITEGIKFNVDEMISIDSTSIPKHLFLQIRKELSQPTMGQSARLKLVVDKTPDGTRSPNIGDAIMMLYFPAKSSSYIISEASVG